MSDERPVMQKNVFYGSEGVTWENTLEKWAHVQVRLVSRDHSDRHNWQLSAVWQMCHDKRHAAIMTTFWPCYRQADSYSDTSRTFQKHLNTESWITLLQRETWWYKYVKKSGVCEDGIC